MTFSNDILTAADTIDKLNAHMAFGDKSTWNSAELRRIAKAVEEEEREASEIQALVEELARAIVAGLGNEFPFEDLHETPQRNFRSSARHLIESGWRKVDPA